MFALGVRLSESGSDAGESLVFWSIVATKLSFFSEAPSMRPLCGRSDIPRGYWANRFAENVGILFLSKPLEQVTPADSSSLLGVQPYPNEGNKANRVNRLWDVIRSTRLDASFAVAGHGLGCYRDNRQGVETFHFAYLT